MDSTIGVKGEKLGPATLTRCHDRLLTLGLREQPAAAESYGLATHPGRPHLVRSHEPLWQEAASTQLDSGLESLVSSTSIRHTTTASTQGSRHSSPMPVKAGGAFIGHYNTISRLQDQTFHTFDLSAVPGSS
jgi:hypothetical protein